MESDDGDKIYTVSTDTLFPSLLYTQLTHKHTYSDPCLTFVWPEGSEQLAGGEV